jgi:hypothetical protein
MSARTVLELVIVVEHDEATTPAAIREAAEVAISGMTVLEAEPAEGIASGVVDEVLEARVLLPREASWGAP